ncbi:uncharacterized protein PF3D7_1120000-like [Argopecten irradians]|uniref:uncharacterized protein PF3D7_1120000-like n=1 Tax=Argopecten irradians TaxID=31199 RepID=UPI003724541C
MASQGTPRAPGAEFRIDGQAMKTQGSSGGGTAATKTDKSTEFDKDAASPRTQRTESEGEGDTEAVPVITQLIGFNQTLQLQIETLRMRLAFDSKSHEKDKCSAVQQTEMKMKEKEAEIDDLKLVLATKEGKIGDLENENKHKGSEIGKLQQYIADIKRDINTTRSFANDLQKELRRLQSENKRLQKGTAYEDKEGHIEDLRNEIEALKSNLETMEKELEKARTIITTQGSKIRLFENDKSNMQVKFKEELSRMSHMMRHEVEKMREVMRKQWEEMKMMREQNDEMGRDIKEIKNMLVMSQQDSNRSRSPQGYGQVFKPTLPTLTRDTKRILTGKRK